MRTRPTAGVLLGIMALAGSALTQPAAGAAQAAMAMKAMEAVEVEANQIRATCDYCSGDIDYVRVYRDS